MLQRHLLDDFLAAEILDAEFHDQRVVLPQAVLQEMK